VQQVRVRVGGVQRSAAAVAPFLPPPDQHHRTYAFSSSWHRQDSCPGRRQNAPPERFEEPGRREGRPAASCRLIRYQAAR